MTWPAASPTSAFKDNLCEEAVLQRCHAGLLLTVLRNAPSVRRTAGCDSNQYTGLARLPSAMYEIRQLEIPDAVMALYSRNGRPTESREFVEARFEACDDLAQGISQFCMTLSFKDDLSEETVLQRCHAGLLQTPGFVSIAEAAWVTCRAAELLQWEQPTFLASPTAGP